MTNLHAGDPCLQVLLWEELLHSLAKHMAVAFPCASLVSCLRQGTGLQNTMCSPDAVLFAACSSGTLTAVTCAFVSMGPDAQAGAAIVAVASCVTVAEAMQSVLFAT